MQNRLLGIHMIVQNEEKYLPRCLNSLRHTDLECFITDTGSTDRTPDLARAYGAAVLHARWEDHFAQARNISLPLATTEWILCLDADEYVIGGLEELIEMLPNVHKSITRLRITIENQFGEGPGDKVMSYPVRLFRAHQGYLYTGRIHEQLIRADDHEQRCAATPKIHTRDSSEVSDASHGSEEETFFDSEPLAPLRLGHDGYLASVIASGDKPKRNLRLIQKELAEQPAQPFHLYNLGVARCQLGELEQAVDAFNESLRLASVQAPYRPTLVKDMAKVLGSLERYEEAHTLLSIECQRYPEYPDLHLLYGELLERQGLEERAYQSYARASTCSVKPFELMKNHNGELEPVYVSEAGSGSYRAYTSMAKLAEKRGFGEESIRLYTLALEHLFNYEAAWTGLAEALQQQGYSDEQIAEKLLDLFNRLSQRQQPTPSGNIHSSTSLPDSETSFLPMVYALAACGAYKQALLLAYDKACNNGISTGDLVQWMLCADRITDAWHLAEERWGTQDQQNTEQIHPEQRSDWALACWASGNRLSASFLVTAPSLERDMWRVADRLLFEYRPDPSARNPVSGTADEQLLHWSEATEVAANQMVIRAVQNGQLVIARQLHERLVCMISPRKRTEMRTLRQYAGLLVRHGYTMLAAEMLIQCMTEGELDAEGLFWLGETLYAKGYVEQALSLFEQALERDSAFTQARAGAAVCYLKLALELIGQERERIPEAAVLADRQRNLIQQLRTAEGMPWRTVYRARERRNHHAGRATSDTASEGAADIAVYDREG
ncbi:glycosyltransferase [Paenibacillus barcinonensis]|uniref:Glycosyltransferase n=1 Tax=Paenibacillus barcinonensis TaxID=198119 RepID=A0A2V4VV53_PAEBA|nr:glycosyltransferase [Paenibacillus barcinonensis]PYE50891.1 tetratricopeptide repeat protein [Paenibacillus barcinonensis]QKS57558.1 glycosyltransferase [Paenibacillus barcinonensis]